LARAVDSALSQLDVRVEIIVSDNNSSDATLQVMKNYEGNPNIRYIRNSLNIGPVANYNQCLNLANGKYFMILGDDDWISGNYCSLLVESLENIDAVFLGKCVAISPDGAIENESSDQSFNAEGHEYIEGFITKDPRFKRHANFMLAARTKALRDVDGFPATEAGQHSDNILLMRLLLTHCLIYNPAAVNFYSVYPDSYGNKNVLAVAIASVQFINYWDSIISRQLSSSYPPRKLKLLRRALIHSITLLYIGRVVRYGNGLMEKVKLLTEFPRYQWIFSSLFSWIFIRTLFGRHGNSK